MPPKIPDWVIDKADRDMRRLGSRIIKETIQRTGKGSKVLYNLRQLMADKAREIRVEPFRQAYMQRIEDLTDDMIDRVADDRIRIGRLSPSEKQMVKEYFSDIDRGRAARQQAARQARRQGPTYQRQVMPAVTDQDLARAAPAARKTVKEPIVRVSVRDLPDNIRPLGEELEKANRAVDQRQYTLDRVRSQETGPVTREKRLLDEARETRNRAQAVLEEAIDRDIPEGNRTRIKQGLKNNNILRIGGVAGKALPILAAAQQVTGTAADMAESGKLQELYKDTKEAVKSPVKTIEDFSKEAADFLYTMKGKNKSSKAIKKKIEKDLEEKGKKGLETLDSILMPLLPVIRPPDSLLNKEKGPPIA